MKRGILATLFTLLCIAASTVESAKPPEVVIETSLGEIVVELYPDKAPKTVQNFLRYVQEGAYDNSSFFRVVRSDNQPSDRFKIEVVQAGQLPKERTHPPIEHENTLMSGLLHKDGTISMARGKPGTAQSSFFICINDQPQLDFTGQRNPDGQGFAAFGRVVAGMERVKTIQLLPTDGQSLIEPVLIKTIRKR